MKHLKAPKADIVVVDDHGRLLQNLKDYTATIFLLFWQRQAIFLSATLLTGYYFDPLKASLFYIIILYTELQDFRHAGRVAALHPNDERAISRTFGVILVNTTLSAAVICVYAVSVAFSQEAGGHFTPLFFLFAAALFAAMNNHQLVPALVIRLTLYGISFAVITIRDLWIHTPPIQSELWLHFFTVIFVMYFLIDCSVVFFKLYRKNLEAMETLKEEHARTTAAYLVKSQFVSTVSHELRTPLTSIKLSLDLINSGALGPVPATMKSIVETAGRNGERLSKLIDDILDLQKLEAGEMRYNMQVLNAKSFLREAIDANARFAESKDVKLVADFPDEPPLFIEADEMRLMQVMSNMISNAVKFSHKGGTVSIGCLNWKGKTTIYVKDQGIGIPDGSRDKVFGKFTQLDSSDRRQVGGTGLGMSISKEIIEHFKGKIDYLSEPGEGTTFFVELPTHKSPARHLEKA
jgi:signal transduction histidine kinase